jgi:hypothetical protein
MTTLPETTLARLQWRAESGDHEAKALLHLIARADKRDQDVAKFVDSYSSTIAALCRRLEALELVARLRHPVEDAEAAQPDSVADTAQRITDNAIATLFEKYAAQAGLTVHDWAKAFNAAPVDDGPVANALTVAEAALADVAEGEPVSPRADNRLHWAETRCTEALAAIRPVMKKHGIQTSEFPPAAPAPETPADALAARPLLEKVAQMGDTLLTGGELIDVWQVTKQAAAWLRSNPPGQPVAIEPRGCPTPGACSCVEPTPSAPEPGEVGEVAQWLLSMRELAGEHNPEERRQFTRAATLLQQQEAELAALRGVPGPTLLDAVRLAEGCHDYSGGHSGAEGEAWHGAIDTVVAVLKRAAIGPWDSQTRAVFGVGVEAQAGEVGMTERRSEGDWVDDLQHAIESKEDDFLGGVCVALALVTAHGEATIWREIVRSVGTDSLLNYAANVNPDDWNLAGFGEYAQSELGKGKPQPVPQAGEVEA